MSYQRSPSAKLLPVGVVACLKYWSVKKLNAFCKLPPVYVPCAAIVISLADAVNAVTKLRVVSIVIGLSL